MCRTELCLVIVGVVAIVSPVTPTFLERNSFVAESMELLQLHCPKKVFNQRIFDEVPVCLEENLDYYPQSKDISNAINAKNGVRVFKNVCKTIPIFEMCLKPVVDLINDCTSEDVKVNTLIDSIKNFFCASFYPGTLNCIMANEQEVSTCIGNNTERTLTQVENTEFMNGDVHVRTSLSVLKDQRGYCEVFKLYEQCQYQVLLRCNDPDFNDQVTSLTRTLSETIKCSEFQRTSGAEYPTSYLLLLNSILVAGVMMFL